MVLNYDFFFWMMNALYQPSEKRSPIFSVTEYSSCDPVLEHQIVKKLSKMFRIDYFVGCWEDI